MRRAYGEMGDTFVGDGAAEVRVDADVMGAAHSEFDEGAAAREAAARRYAEAGERAEFIVARRS